MGDERKAPRAAGEQGESFRSTEDHAAPPHGSGREAGPLGREADPLRRLEERIGRATEAAERLISEAAGGGGGGAKPPPAGWQPPQQERGATSELEALLGALAALRELVPADVAERLVAAIRELLLAIRALIDYLLERLERRSPAPTEVQDIPIE
jgi:hypothetical protein